MNPPPGTEVATRRSTPVAVGVADRALDWRVASLQQAIWDRRPVLADVAARFGSQALYAYAQGYFRNPARPDPARQRELIAAVGREAERLLGPAVSQRAVRQLQRYYFASTADHHGPLCHPFFLNTNLLTAAPVVEDARLAATSVIVLACASVALDNSSFPRGLLFHRREVASGSSVLERLPFFSSHVRPSLVYGLRPYGAADLTPIANKLHNWRRDRRLAAGTAAALDELLTGVYRRPDVLALGSYADQVTVTNAELWQRMFAASGQTAPDLVYLSLEHLVVRLLLDHHLEADTTLHQILFDPSYDALLTRHFEGISGAFSRDDRSGTYLFWAVPPGARYRVPLVREGGALVSADGYRLELTPAAVRRALESHELVPSLLLDFLVLSGYYGLTCLGGFSQVDYLTQMQAAFMAMQRERGDQRSLAAAASAQTRELGGDLTVAMLGGAVRPAVPATGLDLALYGDAQTWPRFVRLVRQVTLGEALVPLLPTCYRIAYDSAERDAALSAVTETEAARAVGLDQTLTPCVTLPN